MVIFLSIARRIGSALPSLIGVVVVTFLLTHALPGDPAAYFAGPTATPATIAQIRRQLGLDQPLPMQFVHYVGQLLRGNLGIALTSGQPVLVDLTTRLPASIELTGCASAFAILVALPPGILGATRPGSVPDHLARVVASVGAAVPTFFMALLLVFVFYYLLGWAPEPLGRLNEIYFSPPPRITGLYLVDSLLAGDWDVFRASFAQLILPAVSLGMFALAPIARVTRAAMIAALDSDYARTARAMGMSSRSVVLGTALRNALVQIIGVLGMVFSFLLGANVLVEQVFGWPGIGAYAVQAVIASDYAAVQGFVLMMGILYVLLNLCIDIVLSLFDPRLRHAG